MFDNVVEMISKQLKVDPSTITRDSRLIDDLKADSANIMVMIMDLEDQFGITVEDDQIMKMKTVGDVVDYIESHK
ncbi:MAG: acyl carrier protein [Clostridia bacterium]|jgi:acyl carrier protein|nr:acyl carrier protein [Clostridia bacterium]